MMIRQGKRALWVASVVVAGAIAIGAAPASGSRGSSGGTTHGIFTETVAGSAAGYDIHGSAKMTIGTAGTAVKVNVSGLDPRKVYGSHLHNGTCASGGGGHYQNLEGGSTVPPNELWLSSGGTGLVPNAGGVAHGSGTATWVARLDGKTTNARSVVVHEPGSGARIACADLD
jgi:hypothetical protein